MILRADIIAAARECLQTKWCHQGRLVGVGIDCVGIVVHAARVLGLPHTDCANYRRRPDGVTLVAHLEKNLVRIDPAAAGPGDVLCMWWVRPDLPYHLGIVTPIGMLHAYALVRKVMEHEMTDSWKERVHSAWAFPGVEPWRR